MLYLLRVAPKQQTLESKFVLPSSVSFNFFTPLPLPQAGPVSIALLRRGPDSLWSASSLPRTGPGLGLASGLGSWVLVLVSNLSRLFSRLFGVRVAFHVYINKSQRFSRLTYCNLCLVTALYRRKRILITC